MPSTVYDPETEDDKHNPGAQHETDMLERMYHAPSATTSGSDQLNRRQLKDRESGGGSQKTSSGVNSEKSGLASSGTFADKGFKSNDDAVSGTNDTIGKGYKGTDQKKQSWFGRHKKSAAGWVISLIILGGGGSAILGPVAGPFEFIHFSQIVQNFNFGDAQNGGDDRMSKAARYIYYKGKPQNARMSIAGNYIADKIETRMNDAGFKTAYTKLGGYVDGYYLDKSKFKGTEFKDVANKSDTQVKDYFKSQYNVDVSTRDGKLFIDGGQLKYRTHLKFLTSVQKSAGVGKIPAAVQARVMGFRGKVTWHPIEKLKQKTVRAREAAFREREKARIQNGNDGTPISTENKADPKDENATKNATDVKDGADQVISEGKDAASSPEKMENLKSSVGAKLTGGGALAVGTLCVLHGIAANVDQIEQTQVIAPLIRVAVEVIALGGQIMFGKKDVDPEQLGFYKKQLYNAKTGKSWTDSPAVQSAVGEKVTGSSKADPKIGQENIMQKLFGNIPGLDPVCSVINSAPGQVLQIGLGILGGPISAVVTVAFTALGPTVLDAISRYIAGQPIDTEASGDMKGTYAMYGGRLAANDQMMTLGGQEMSPQQESVLNMLNNEQQKAEFAQHSLAYRIFNPNDYRSLVGSFLDKQKPDAMANVASLAHGLLNFGSTIASMPQTVFSGNSNAAKEYDYGFLKIGYTADEFDNAATNNPWENACYVVGCPENNITGLLQGPDKEKYMDRTQTCFGMTLDEDGNVATAATPPTYKQIHDNDCKDQSQDWLRIRFFIYDTQVLESMACFMGQAESCAAMHMTGGGSAYNTLMPKNRNYLGAFA